MHTKRLIVSTPGTLVGAVSEEETLIKAPAPPIGWYDNYQPRFGSVVTIFFLSREY